MKKFFTLTLMVLISASVWAQNRYLEPVFENYTVTKNVPYGVNATVLLFSQVGQAVPQPLIADIYQPAEDTAALRPLVLYFHTGNFLPHPQNGSVSGTLRDSTSVEICRRLAKHGYVSASVDYRLGWNPFATTKDERVFTLINAAYRGVQDARTCIRYFKRSVVEAGNPFRIDTSRITLYGQGTGGYVSMNTAILDDYNKILTATDGKFITADADGNPIPMIIPQINGDIEGKVVGFVPPGVAYPFPTGDTLCYPNHVAYNSDFQLCINLTGAIADSSWVDPGHVPMISFHVPNDPFAPYKSGLVLVPVNPPLEVVEVQGSYFLQKLSNDFGNNDVFSDANFSTGFEMAVNERSLEVNDGFDGLMPLFGTGGAFDSSPWDFWDPATNVNHQAGLQSNPDMTREKAMLYIDTIFAYSIPRMFTALDLNLLTGTKEILKGAEISLTMYPNPVSDRLLIGTEADYPIRSISIYNLEGKLVQQINDVDNNYYSLPVGQHANGQYIVHLNFDEGIIAKQILKQ